MLLIDFVRSHGCKASSAAARPPTAVCARYFWTKSRCCPARCWRRGPRPQRHHAGGPAGGSSGVRRVYRRSGRRAVRLLQPGLYHERAGAVPREPDPTEEEIKEYLAATSAAAPATRASCAAFRTFLRGKSRRRPQEWYRQQAGAQKGRYAAGNRTARLQRCHPADCLMVKLLRCPHANAIVKTSTRRQQRRCRASRRLYLGGCDQQGRRYTKAGQTYPEPAPMTV